MAEYAALVLHGGREHAACAGMVDAEEPLHHWRGAADLVTGERAPAGSGEAAVQRVLHGVRRA